MRQASLPCEYCRRNTLHHQGKGSDVIVLVLLILFAPGLFFWIGGLFLVLAPISFFVYAFIDRQPWVCQTCGRSTRTPKSVFERGVLIGLSVFSAFIFYTVYKDRFTVDDPSAPRGNVATVASPRGGAANAPAAPPPEPPPPPPAPPAPPSPPPLTKAEVLSRLPALPPMPTGWTPLVLWDELRRTEHIRPVARRIGMQAVKDRGPGAVDPDRLSEELDKLMAEYVRIIEEWMKKVRADERLGAEGWVRKLQR